MKKVITALVAILLPVITAGNSPAQSEPAIPQLAAWETNMLTYGTRLCEYLKSHPQGYSDPHLAATYYDAQWVMYQIGDYTKNYSYWNACAQAAEYIYRETYVVPNGARVPGYWNFTHGLTQDFLRTGDTASKNAAISLSRNAGYAYDGTSLDQTVNAGLSREVSYAIMAYLNEELLGNPRRSRLAPMVDQALGHIDQWTISRTAPYVRPFMVALTAHALMSWHEVSGDTRVLPALRAAADYIWDTCWMPEAGSFSYTDRSIGNADDLLPAPDLSLLIAPMYAWLYHYTGDVRYRERGDMVFAGGVTKGYVSGNKQFNQSYRVSFEFVRLRKLPPQAGRTATPTPTATPASTKTPTATPTRTATPTATSTPTKTVTITPTKTVTITPTRAATIAPTWTPAPTLTSTPAPTGTSTQTPTATKAPNQDGPGTPRGLCGNGLPEVDSDGDGVLDCRERCAADPAKTDPGTCGCGTPDTDANANGISDCLYKEELRFRLDQLRALLPKVREPKTRSQRSRLQSASAKIRAAMSDIQSVAAKGAGHIQVKGDTELISSASSLARAVKAALKVKKKGFVQNKKRAVKQAALMARMLS